MSDVVVTVGARQWAEWLQEGALAGDPPEEPDDIWGETEYLFSVPTRPARCLPGDRVYVAAGGRLRGYAPLVRVEMWHDDPEVDARLHIALVRAGGAVALTIPETIPSFRGYRYRWWSREDEMPFPDWRTL